MDPDTQLFSDLIYDKYRQMNQKQSRVKTVPINKPTAPKNDQKSSFVQSREPGPSTSRQHQFNEEAQNTKFDSNQLNKEAVGKSNK